MRHSLLGPCLQVKTVTPVGDRVFVKAEEAEVQTVGGILLPSTAQKRPTQGTVQSGGKAVKVSCRCRRQAAARTWVLPRCCSTPPLRLPLQAGDKVIYSKFAGTELELQGDSYVLLKVRHPRARTTAWQPAPEASGVGHQPVVGLHAGEALQTGLSLLVLAC